MDLDVWIDWNKREMERQAFWRKRRECTALRILVAVAATLLLLAMSYVGGKGGI